jgi:RND superfamily putative drug exporter
MATQSLTILRRLAAGAVARPRTVLGVWLVALAVATTGALRLARIAQGGSEAIRGSESHRVMQALDSTFGPGASLATPVVLTSDSLSTSDARFESAVTGIVARLKADSVVRDVTHFWNTDALELLGRDDRSALLLVRPNTETLAESEAATERMRARMSEATPPGFSALVTGMSAMFYDLNRRSAVDLLRAELVGIPLTLIVLLIVFRTPVAAGLALAVAIAAVTLSSGFLYAANTWLPVSVLAQNVVTMVGLGAGTDYALFVLSHHRETRAEGEDTGAAIVRAIERAGPAVLVSGLAVACGFASLFLVRARFVHSLALGGVAVVLLCLAATFTLLPALMQLAGKRVTRQTSPRAAVEMENAWTRWANVVMRRPLLFLGLAIAISAAFAWPATRARAWTFGARDLPLDIESRAGFETLSSTFEPGWAAPTVLLITANRSNGIWEADAQRAGRALVGELRNDPRVAEVLGWPRLLEALGTAGVNARTTDSLPEILSAPAKDVVSADGRVAAVPIVLRVAPESPEARDFVLTMRQRQWPALQAAGLSLQTGGGSALLLDFDTEMFQSVRRVMLAVIVVTFVLLFWFFRSAVVPVKAIAANLLSVVAAYGFLVLVFQDGVGASLIGITPPGGLNSFVVLMLFTILFGLSMDYEIFLLSQIRSEFVRTGHDTESVASGLSGTAGVITGAAAVMVCLFGSFGFFGLTASREFGLGLAFAVAFDATVVRLLIVPATMRLMGRRNWWPGL